ncbi:MAG: hypothetical protein IKX39_05770 [Muribaculaceae bacterium]|nr:hypothetical protein [Muribaculaceae bacterium]
MRHTLLRFNRLVLHSRSLLAQCFAAPRQGLLAGCAYPKSCIMLIARYACHRPSNTSPHRQNQWKPKCVAATNSAVLVLRRTLAR